MTLSEIVANVDRLLNAGNPKGAGELAIQSMAELPNDGRIILRILTALDRERLGPEALALSAAAEGGGITLAEGLVFALRAKFRADDYAGSLGIIERLLEYSPNHIEALRTGGRIGNLTRDDSLGLQYWERLARTSGTDQEAALQAARIRMRRHQHAEALDWARQAAEVQPGAVEPLRIGVSAGIAVGWPENCNELLVRLVPIDHDWAVHIASQIATIFDADIASRALALLLQRYPNHERLLDIADKACSQWLVAGLERELASRDVEAAGFYYALRRVRPGDSDAVRALDRLLQPSVVAMREAFSDRNFAATVEHGTIAVRLDPDHVEALQTMGRAQFGQGEIASARDTYRRVTELHPEDGRDWLTYGLILNHANDRVSAFSAFRKAQQFARDADAKREAEASLLALHPSLIQESQQSLAEGAIEAAWQSYDAAVAIRPDDAEELRRTLLRVTREKVRELWNGKSASVVPLCHRYLAEAPSDAYVLTVLGRTLMGSHAYSEALPIWERLCARDLSDGHYRLQVARCCRALNLVEKGILSAEEALRLDPGLREASEVAEFLKIAQRRESRSASAERQ